MIYYFLIFFWFIRQIKAGLFWFYLWQLKEYHLSRFINHFRTEKGRKLLFNPLVVIKIAIFFVFLAMGYISVTLGFYDAVADFIILSSAFIFFLIYFLEAAKFISSYISNKFIKPVFTKKIQFLSLIVLTFTFGFLFYTLRFSRRPLFELLAFDILTPLIISLIVLFFQPLAVLGRNQIIRKAKKKRRKFKELLVIGIAGSYGKTSTKELLASILSKKYKVLKTKEHQNSEVGISQCILDELNSSHQIFVCEMGAYNLGGIKLLCDIVQPKIGILTGINEQHMALFGSQENIIKTKFELIESLPDNGIAFFNGKNKYCLDLYKQAKTKKVLYGQKAQFFGEENIEGAKAVARELGMSESEISKAVQKIENKFPGIELKKGKNGLNIIDATYSANPNGVMAHLDYLKIWKGKKVIIMPCLIELGRVSKEVHKRIGEKIGEVCDLAIITTKERFKEIKQGAVGKGMKSENILFLENPKLIFEKIKDFNKENDIILLESRVPKLLIEQLK